MSHGSVSFTPGYYVLIALYVLIPLAALGLIFDAMRPRRAAAVVAQRAGGRRREPIALYQVLCGLFLVIFILGQFKSMPLLFKAGSYAGLPLVAAVEVAYLLRVVYPKPLPTTGAAGAADAASASAAPEAVFTSDEEQSNDERH